AAGAGAQPRHRRREAVGDPLALLELGPGEQAGKLVPAPAVAAVAATDGVGDRVRRLAEHDVTVRVAGVVVDLLEVVEVAEEQHEVLARAARALDLTRDRIVEGATVPEPRQRVAVRELLRE